MKTSVHKEYKKVKLDDIVPYWRNPRDNVNAIEKVKRSIEEFDYLNPIILDTKNVIIAGHSRYKALRQLGYTEADCIIANLSDLKAKEYRIIDNKTSDYAEWNDDLKLELREIGDEKLISEFFPDFKIDVSEVIIPLGGSESISGVEGKLASQYEDLDDARANMYLTLTCPHCYKELQYTRKAILTNRDLETEK